MTPIEANAVLTRAALIDPRMKRVNPQEQADMATAWASTLTRGGIELSAALVAVEEHYLVSRDAVTVADIVERAAQQQLPGIRDITADLEAEWGGPKALTTGGNEDRMHPAGGWPTPIEGEQ